MDTSQLKIKNNKGQVALILILITAAALIFLAITLNWGRVAQMKTFTTMAASQSASLMASNAASYGEMVWKTHDDFLGSKTKVCEFNQIIISIILIIIAIVVTIVTWGAATPLLAVAVAHALLIAAIIMAVLSFIIQLVIIQPMITNMWNKLQENRPVSARYLEGGITTAFANSVTDQVKITDYFDMNVDGIYGLDGSALKAKDTISRFAFFYTERLKSLRGYSGHGIDNFINGLSNVLYGVDCSQGKNKNDPCCAPINCPAVTDCSTAANKYSVCCLEDTCKTITCDAAHRNNICCKNVDPNRTTCLIPEGFKFTDPCTDTSNPYCNECCVPKNIKLQDPLYDSTNPTAEHPSQYFESKLRPAGCPSTDIPSQCLVNNPFGLAYPFIYDRSYQNYDGITKTFKVFDEILKKFVNEQRTEYSFLARLGRDIPQAPSANTVLSQVGDFPNGAFPLFWEMSSQYSPMVSTINASIILPEQCQWCANYPRDCVLPDNYPVLAQMSFSDGCQGDGCCVNKFSTSLPVPVGTPNPPAPTFDSRVIDVFGGTPLPPIFNWVKGDNRFCSAEWPYENGCTANDNLDTLVQTISQFVVWGDTLANQGIKGLKADTNSWYPMAAGWIAPKCNTASADPYASNAETCNPGQDGRLLQVRTQLDQWRNALVNADYDAGVAGAAAGWLQKTYLSNTAWCLPPDPNSIPVYEKDFIVGKAGLPINPTTGVIGGWGNLASVEACLEYNSENDQKFADCAKALTPDTTIGEVCPATVPDQCSELPRSLVAGAIPAFSATTACDGTTGFKKWVQDSYNLAVNQSLQFSKRDDVVGDIYDRAVALNDTINDGYTALNNFLGSASSPSAPAQQLMEEISLAQKKLKKLPNYVIYGWRDKDKPKNAPPERENGYWHIVKIRAYFPGRCGNGAGGAAIGCQERLPWFKTYTQNLVQRCFEIVNWPGKVFSSVTRWDEDHSSWINFANKIGLWRFTTKNPKGPAVSTTSVDLDTACLSANGVGLGLRNQTVAWVNGLRNSNNAVAKEDWKAFTGAFMLSGIPNDNSARSTAPSASDCAADPNNPECLGATDVLGEETCRKAIKDLLDQGVESRSCAEYTASGGHFILHFVPCNGARGRDFFPPDETKL